jgi:hypothetical protein
MASGPNPKSAVMIATVGCVAFWTAFRVLRQRVIDALAKVGVTAVPPIDFYDALVETGKNVIDAANLRQRKCPIKPDSLSRTGVGVEFYQTFKGDKQNQREFLFSLGVDDKNTVFVIQVGVNPALQAFFANPQVDAILNTLYQKHLEYMPSRDVTDALVGLIASQKGIPMKQTGGVYFVPDCAISAVDSVFHDLNAAGCRCTLLKQDLRNNPELVKQVLEATNDSLVEECQKMNDVMQDIIDNDKAPRANGMATRMQQLGEFARLAEYYEEQFGTNLQAARSALSKSFELIAELQIRKSAGK